MNAYKLERDFINLSYSKGKISIQMNILIGCPLNERVHFIN